MHAGEYEAVLLAGPNRMITNFSDRLLQSMHTAVILWGRDATCHGGCRYQYPRSYLPENKATALDWHIGCRA